MEKVGKGGGKGEEERGKGDLLQGFKGDRRRCPY